ncbi:OLC1v1013615C1 [Oldenlandia corymbosa var. corymbosa]|uniref:OLC1v1013615C1 n=1 Tax=Oldenlandia corymbosa var. corymbosa TaxID=529605 RepID=A0AAV1DYP0_OLDCO|nr:OLC1v1013615C1 [Oldenlandia corymbosa var. corymbosa]
MRLPTISSVSKLPDWLLSMKELAAKGNWKGVLSFHHELKGAGIRFSDPSLFHPVLKACSVVSFEYGKSIHASSIKLGLDSYTSMGNSIIDFYLKSQALSCAAVVFDGLENKDSVSWNIMIHEHLVHFASERGLDLFFHAKISGFKPNISTLVLVIRACRELFCFDEGLVVHGYVVKSGFWTISSVQNSLLCLYADIGLGSARKLFDEMIDRDVISWSAIIVSHTKFDEPAVALNLFQLMVNESTIEADGPIIVTVLKACTYLQNIRIGNSIHAFVISKGLKNDLFVGNSLIDFYAKCDDVDSAFTVFSEMPQKNAVSWNSLLSGYVQSEKHSDALGLILSMRKVGFEADGVTFVNLLQVCKHLKDPYACKLIHSRVFRQGYESNHLVNNSLMDAYAKCYCISLVWKLFSCMKHRDVVTWSTMIAAFTYCGMPAEAIFVFVQMKQRKEKFNAVTMLNLFEACSLYSELAILEWAHAITICYGLDSNSAVGTALLDMYAKCGSVEASRKVFEQMPQRDVVTCSAMIAAYGTNGLPHDALLLLSQMESQGLKPNLVTSLSLLSACSHGGLVEKGLSIFKNLVQEYGAKIGLKHYSCLVDLLARAGKVGDAMDLVEKMSQGSKVGASAWSSILSACRHSGDSEVGEGVLPHLLQLEPSVSAGYLLASNMYASGGSWSNAANLRSMMNENGVKVLAGSSFVHFNSDSTL